MAGIYIHIPFCKQACSYCNFHFSTNLNRKEPLLDAISKELGLRKHYLENKEVKSIYLGGGTPSLLTFGELNTLFEKLYKNFNISENVEVTLEANPDDLEAAYLKELHKSSVNRLSIGVQSFFDEDLRFMSRAHSAEEAKRSILTAQDVGFQNINIDLIFGSQTTTDEMWERNLAQFFSMKIPHLSAYSLTIEEKTALSAKIKNGHVPQIDENRNSVQYHLLLKAIARAGYEQYEVSNYCKGGQISNHNASYWFGDFYLGLGPSAHSYNGTSRQWNVANNKQYLDALSKNELPFEREKLSEIDRYHEYLLTSLRTKWGADGRLIRNKFSNRIWSYYEKKLLGLGMDGLVIEANNLRIDSEYLFTSDEVVRELMFE